MRGGVMRLVLRFLSIEERRVLLGGREGGRLRMQVRLMDGREHGSRMIIQVISF